MRIGRKVYYEPLGYWGIPIHTIYFYLLTCQQKMPITPIYNILTLPINLSLFSLILSLFRNVMSNRNASDLKDTKMNRELHLNTAEMAVIVTRNVPQLTHEQKII